MPCTNGQHVPADSPSHSEDRAVTRHQVALSAEVLSMLAERLRLHYGPPTLLRAVPLTSCKRLPNGRHPRRPSSGRACTRTSTTHTCRSGLPLDSRIRGRSVAPRPRPSARSPYYQLDALILRLHNARPPYLRHPLSNLPPKPRMSWRVAAPSQRPPAPALESWPGHVPTPQATCPLQP